MKRFDSEDRTSFAGPYFYRGRIDKSINQSPWTFPHVFPRHLGAISSIEFPIIFYRAAVSDSVWTGFKIPNALGESTIISFENPKYAQNNNANKDGEKFFEFRFKNSIQMT